MKNFDVDVGAPARGFGSQAALFPMAASMALRNSHTVSQTGGKSAFICHSRFRIGNFCRTPSSSEPCLFRRVPSCEVFSSALILS